MPADGGFLCEDIIKDAIVQPTEAIVKRPRV